MKKYELIDWIQELEQTVDSLDKMIGELFKEIQKLKEQSHFDHPWTIYPPMGSDGTAVKKKLPFWPTYGDPTTGDPLPINPFPSTGDPLPKRAQTWCDIGQGGSY